MNTWNISPWNIPASCCSRFYSTIAVPVPPPILNPCKASCRVMVLCSILLTIGAQTFQMTSTNTMPLYPPPPLVISTIIVHVNASGMYQSRNGPLLYSPICSTSRCLGIYPWFLPLDMSSGVLPSYPMLLPTGLPIVSALPLQYPLLPEAHL